MPSKKLSSAEFTLTCPICAEEVSSLQTHVQSSHSEQEIQDAIFRDKARGIPDIEIGRKYGVTFRYVEKLVTQTNPLHPNIKFCLEEVKWISKD